MTPLSAALVCAFTFAQPAAAEADVSAIARVRSSNAMLATLIEQVSERSATFRSLVETINASDGIVYVEEGECGRIGVRACLVAVTVAGPNRILWVRVETRMADSDVMGLIGHELRHSIEVLSDPSVTTNIAMYFFYRRQGSRRTGNRFETHAAIEAGTAVRAEARKYRATVQAN